jgi:hypothetical protein
MQKIHANEEAFVQLLKVRNFEGGAHCLLIHNSWDQYGGWGEDSMMERGSHLAHWKF